MKAKKYTLTLLLYFLILTLPAFAHPGRTDSKGGHYSKDASEYHYHHGYPAHQHTSGVCPYDFDDQTDHSSGTRPQKAEPTPKPQNTQTSFSPKRSSTGNGALAVIPITLASAGAVYARKRKRTDNK